MKNDLHFLTLISVFCITSCNKNPIVGKWKYQDTFEISYNTNEKIEDYKDDIGFNNEAALCRAINDKLITYDDGDKTEDFALNFSTEVDPGKKDKYGNDINAFCLNYRQKDENTIEVLYSYCQLEDGYHIMSGRGIYLYDATLVSLSYGNGVDIANFQCVSKVFTLTDQSHAVFSLDGLLEISGIEKISFVIKLNYQKI